MCLQDEVGRTGRPAGGRQTSGGGGEEADQEDFQEGVGRWIHRGLLRCENLEEDATEDEEGSESESAREEGR